MHGKTLFIVMLVGLAGCYYSPQRRGEKANPNYLSEAEAEKLIGELLAPHGIKFITNMKLKRDDVVFTADGYDRVIRVGFEYRSHEGLDFEPDGDDAGPGLSNREIAALEKRQQAFREYFLVVEEGPREQVEQAVEKFVARLFEWEVLKKAKTEKKKELFPEDAGRAKDMLPWESTKDVRKKRMDMERQEKSNRPEGYGEDDDATFERELQGDTQPTGSETDDWLGDEDKPGGDKEQPPADPAAGDPDDEAVEDDDFDF